MKIEKTEKIIDAAGKTLGRVSSQIAMSLMGKDKATFERNIYSGRPVKVLNSSKIKINPKKLENITHKRYSGYPGGLRVQTGTEIATKKGMKEMVRLAVYDMLPGNKIRPKMMKNLKIED